jgi:glycosyltransferase involved in cell wall biosynthesis
MKNRTTSAVDGHGKSVVIDGRMIYQPQCFGIARVIIEMLHHFPTDSGVPISILVPAGGRSECLDVDRIPSSIERIQVTSPISAPHRFAEVNGILRGRRAGAFFAPYHALAPLHVSAPMVAAVHDCILETDVRLIGSRIRQVAYIANTSRVLRQATAVVTPSDATAAEIGGFYGHVPPITVCRNGVDPDNFGAAGTDGVAAARTALCLPDRFILHVGSRRIHKNQAVLVRALAELDESVSLVLVGRADPRIPDPVPALVQELGVGHRVRMLDSVPDDLLMPTYRAATVFAFPSTAEGFGLPPLEAQAAGVPVVASALPAVAEAVGDGAVLVSPYDHRAWATALARVIGSEELRQDLVRRGTAVARASTWTVGALKLHRLLTSIATGGGSPVGRWDQEHAAGGPGEVLKHGRRM